MKKIDSVDINSFVKKNKLFCLLLLIAILLMFWNLGDRIMSGDEAGYSTHSLNILKYGYPRMYDGTSFVGFEYQIGPGYAFMMNTWLGEYMIAFAFLIFGVSNFAARFFPVLFGLATLVLVYYLALRISKKKEVALLSMLALLLTPFFYIISRTANYYSLAMFLTALILYCYIGSLENSKNSKPWLAISSILLFYTHIQLFFFVMFSIALHIMINYRNKWKGYLKPLIAIFAFTFPYFVFWLTASSVLSTSASVNSLAGAFLSLRISFLYYFLLAFPFILVFLLPKILYRKDKKKFLDRIERNYGMLFLLVISIAVLTALLDNLSMPAVRRILVPTLPAFMILIGGLLSYVKSRSKAVAVVLVLLLFTSNLLFVFPINLVKVFVDEESLNEEEKNFVDKAFDIRSYQYEYLYELTHDYISPDQEIIELITVDRKEGDVLLTNANMPLVYFYINVPQLIEDPPKSWSYKSLDPEFVKQARIDWIIVRDLEKEAFVSFIDENIDLSNYDTVVLNQNDEPWADFVNPINRRWKTDRQGEIVIYHLRS